MAKGAKKKLVEAAEKPKRPTSGHLFYQADQAKLLKEFNVKVDPKRRKEIASDFHKLTADEAAFYKSKGLQSSKLYKERIGTKKERKVPIQTTHKLKFIVQLISRLSNEQIAAVKALGFGGLLELKCTSLDRQLCEWLLQNFDPNSVQLRVHGKKLHITPAHVQLLLGLKNEGLEVSLDGPGEDIARLCEQYRLQVVNGVVSLVSLQNTLNQSTVADEEFKISFSLFILGGLLCPTTKPGIHPSFLHAVKDLDNIGKLNWAKFVLQFLVQGAMKLKKNGQKSGSGCLFLLKLFYLEHVIPGNIESVSADTDRSLPRIGTWGDTAIKQRLSCFEENGGYDNDDIHVTIDNQFTTGSRSFTEVISEIRQCRNVADEVKCSLAAALNDYKQQSLSMNDLIKGQQEILRQFNALQRKWTNFGDAQGTCPAEVHNEVGKCGSSGSKDENNVIVEPGKVEELYELKVPKKEKFSGLEPSGFKDEPKDKCGSDSVQVLSKPPVGGFHSVRRSLRPRKVVIPLLEGSSTNEPLDRRRTRRTQERNPSRYLASPYTDTGRKKVTNRKKKANQRTVKNPIKLTAPRGLHNQIEVERWARVYMFSHAEDPTEIVVKIGTANANRELILVSLRPAKWLWDAIINLVVNKLAWEQRMQIQNNSLAFRKWYMPTEVAYTILQIPGASPATIYNDYTGEDRFMGELDKVQQIYIPINDQRVHWYLCVIHLEEGCCYLYDSLPPKSVEQKNGRVQAVERVRDFFADIFLMLDANTRGTRVRQYPVRTVEWVPNQRNSWDCGLYIIHFMQQDRLHSGLDLQLPEDTSEERKTLAVNLFTCAANEVRDDIIKAKMSC